MNMPTLVITGIGVTDEIFQTDPHINGQTLTWNISRIRRDAEAGFFGPPIRKPMSELPIMSPEEAANIDWARVDALSHRPELLDRPALYVERVRDGRHGYRYCVDGNHTVCARRKLGLADFATYVVPSDREENYRVRCFVDGREVPLPFD